MPRSHAPANLVARDPSIIPDQLASGVVTLQHMREQGLLRDIDRLLPLSRQGGYLARAMGTAVLLFLSARPGTGLRPFLEGLDRSLRRRVAGVAGLVLIPTAASLSRALGCLSMEAVEACLDQLLLLPVRGLPIFHHAASHHRDALGRVTHFVDIDPTVKAARQRDLEGGDDLPPGIRRAPGQAGYTGRKRGEVRVRAVPIAVDGPALWLGLRLLPCEGSIVPVTGDLTKQAVAALAQHGITSDQIVVRGDGEFGSVGAMKAIGDQGAHLLVRLPRSQLLDREAVAAQLASARWRPVAPGSSSARHEACELGTFILVSADGKEEVEVRVVAMRTPSSGSADGHGVVRDGYRIELFATSLAADAWPAADVITRFHGRSAFENRLAQEDRELGLGRTFSFHPAGQLWVWGMGLFLWNWWTAEGWRRSPPPEVDRPLRARPAEKMSDTQPEATPSSTAGETPALTPEPPPPPPTVVPSPPAPQGDAVEAATRSLGAITAEAFADVSRMPSWRLDEQGQVRCPKNERLKPFSARVDRAGRGHLQLRTDPHVCVGCTLHARCFGDEKLRPYKQLSRAISREQHDVAKQALDLLSSVAPPPPRRRRRDLTSPAPPPPAPSAPRLPSYRPPEAIAAGPWQVEAPLLVPSELRRLGRQIPRGKWVRVYLRDALPLPPRHPAIADGPRGRAHRRLDHETRRERQRGPVNLWMRT